MRPARFLAAWRRDLDRYLHRHRRRHLYLAAADGPAVLRSLTALATLRPFAQNLPSGPLGAIAIDSTGGAVYLATASAGLRRVGR